jgi:hypothetical protein
VLSEAKIQLGRPDQYVVLPVTVLENLERLTLSLGAIKRTLKWSRTTKNGFSHLMLDAEMAREPVDGLRIVRETDPTGLKSLSYI